MAERRGSRQALASTSPVVSRGELEPHPTSLPDRPAVLQSNARTRRWTTLRTRRPRTPQVGLRSRPPPKCAWSPNIVQFDLYRLNNFVKDFIQARRPRE